MLMFSLALGIIVLLLLLGMPIAFAFGLGALIYLFGTGADISFLIPYAFQTTTGFALLALPLFILAGIIMAQAGISNHLLNFVNSFVGRIKGGLGAVTVVTCALFGAISGSSSAAIVAIGQVMIPRMVKEGYSVGHATSLVACSSVLALMIPPSVPMIVFAVTGGLSVSAAFLSTVIPGLVLMSIYIGLNFFFLRNSPDIQVEERLPLREASLKAWQSGKRAIWALLMPLLILGSIYGGIATPTEAAAIALIYATFAGFVLYRTLNARAFWNGLIQATMIIGSIIAVLFFLFMMSRAMILQQVPGQVTDFLLGLSDNPIIILLLINLVLILMGMVVDDISGSILAAVVLLPLATAIGVHPIHFAAIVGVNLGMGNVSPPCAPMLYMAAGISKASLDQYFGTTMKFLLLGHLPMVLIVTFVPELALMLPRLLLGIN